MWRINRSESWDFLKQSFYLQSLAEVGGTKNGTVSKVTNNNNVGRVASWAVSFENLLMDKDGVAAFEVMYIRPPQSLQSS